MADVEQRVVRYDRHEFILTAPTNAAEVGKAYAIAKQKAESLGVPTTYDDSIQVDARDGEVVLYFTTERTSPT